MNKSAKLYADLLADPSRFVAFRDFEAMLREFGFVHRRTGGSHRQYRHPLVPRPLPIQPEGKDAKPYQVRQFMVMVERYGIEVPK